MTKSRYSLRVNKTQFGWSASLVAITSAVQVTALLTVAPGSSCLLYTSFCELCEGAHSVEYNTQYYLSHDRSSNAQLDTIMYIAVQPR